MGALDGILAGLIGGLLFAARNEIEDGVHPASSCLPCCLCSPTGRHTGWIGPRLLQERTNYMTCAQWQHGYHQYMHISNERVQSCI